MRNKRAMGAAIRTALEHARYELLPTARIEEAVLAHVPITVTVTVTASPTKGLAATLDLTERLLGHGYTVVPHLAARMIAGKSQLAETVDQLRELGVSNVFCPAGDQDPPAGDYPAALPMLRDLSDLGQPFAQVGITGYPESHPSIDDDVTIQSMWDKRAHATYIVSNLCFDPAAIQTWLQRMRKRGIELPVLIGLPGPVERTKLLAMSTKIGVGQSMRFLKSHAGTFARIAAPGGFSPERFLRASRYLADPELLVDGLHIYTFNQAAETEAWRQDLLAGAGAH